MHFSSAQLCRTHGPPAFARYFTGTPFPDGILAPRGALRFLRCKLDGEEVNHPALELVARLLIDLVGCGLL